MITLYVIAAILVALAALVCYTIYRSRARDIDKLVSLPLILILSAFMFYHYIQSLGKPLEGKPDGEWTYVHHVTDGNVIELWIKQDSGSKLYVFPYSDEDRQKLEQGQQQTQQGIPVVGEFEEVEEGGPERTPKKTLTLKLPNHNTIKTYEEN